MTTLRIVTGAAGLIGRAVCQHLRNTDGVLLALDTHPGPDDSTVLRLDSTSEAFATLLSEHLAGAERAELIHTAGTHPPLTTITDTPPEEFARHTADLTHTYATARTFALATRAAGIPASAVLLSTVGAHRYLAGYDAARAGIESLARSFTLEFARHLSVRAAAVGPIAQSASTQADGPLAPALLALVPRGTYADLQDIATALATYATAPFDTTAGHTLTLDGGLTIQLRPADVERRPGTAKPIS
ncbi:SDR family NAD(P)-dependent oxidoreductase [Kitasatospora kifunensis]|uniref:Gluconate 5-dehydrogenase n=1 Tax=Kitasatospora kifunensis TaxID=58351 RepID=A0A7W7VZ76_KITKI|nr:SDR family oxidoreductase [Kitasatospora kifunensis]MBB4928276.1 gluconate 5-dehydrogenase [Kitasatospora kifunensis]